MTATIGQAAKDLLRQSLEEHPGAQLFVLLDPSRDTKITTVAQGLSERAECLYIGSARQEFEDDAPWLVQCGEMDGFSDYLVDEGLGQHWCVFVISGGSFDDLFRHFRHLTKIRQVDGESLFFRYYDPDVLGSIPALPDRCSTKICVWSGSRHAHGGRRWTGMWLWQDATSRNRRYKYNSCTASVG